jgi:hypothetical protein
MNLAAGIDVRLGEAVKNTEIDRENGHLIKTNHTEYRCRWLIDAAGFASPLGRKLGLIKSNNDSHPINSYWGRFKNIANLNLLGDINWRSRVSHTTRTLATTHFMYGGYWIWLIPIDREIFSIGVTNRSDLSEIKITTQQEFIDFLKTHRCMRQLLVDDTEILDFNKLQGISRQAKQAFSEDRWFLTGMSAAILDPMLSPGSALLADNNRMIGDLIASDMRGETRAFTNKVKAYNAYTKVWQENFFLHIKGHYHDCFDRQRANFETLLMQWFGIVLPISMSENWGYDPAMSDGEFDMLEQKGMHMLENSCIHKVEAVVEQLQNFLRDHQAEHANNQGQFYDIEIGEKAMHHTRTFGRELCPAAIANIEQTMIQVAFERSLARMCEIKNLTCNPSILKETALHATQKDLGLMQSFNLLKGKLKSSRSAVLESTAA